MGEIVCHIGFKKRSTRSELLGNLILLCKLEYFFPLFEVYNENSYDVHCERVACLSLFES